MDKKSNKMIGYVLIVVAVVGFLVYISINKKVSAPANLQLGQVTENTNMSNSQPTSEANTNNGVKITILKEGTGQAAKLGDSVTMNYTGRFADGTVFDSNIDPKFQHVVPFDFVIGAGKVIKGWDVGVAGMKVGEKRNLVIQPDYAYGAQGAGATIPPNSTLYFDVELLAINK